MPKMTLLDMTQNILSAMDSDEVNSISDTVEALQVAEVIRETFYELQSGLSVPSREGIIQLDALGDATKPNYLRLPANVKNIVSIRYNYREASESDYRLVTYLTPEQFLTRQRSLNDNIVLVEDFSQVGLYAQTNKNPSFWTTFDNEYLVFDSFNEAQDSTLQNSQTLCWGQYEPLFTISDLFVPDLDSDLFPMLLAEAKATCFINFKQVSSAKEEQRSRRQRVRAQNDSWRANQRKPYNRTPDYGRRRR